MTSNPLFAFLRLFVPGALAILLVGMLYSNSEENHRLDKIKHQETLDVGLAATTLLHQMEGVLGDIAYLAGDLTLQQLANDPASAEIRRLESSFINLSGAKKVYDQIRWINQAGQEVIRVDLRDGQGRLVPADKLQNKADRYYFREAMQADAGRIYLSPLDLNVDNGQIEKPFKPMLRVATAVADRQGNKQGVVVLNYLGDALLKHFVSSGEASGKHIALLNSAGYWLHAPNAADEWGFMFNDVSRSLAARYPDSWQRLQAPNGQFADEHGLWTFQSVHPYPASRGTGLATDDYRWLVVSHLGNDQLAALTRPATNGKWLFTLLLLLLLGAAIFYLQRSQARERQAEKRFRTIFDHAMVGIARTSLDRRWIEVNPALCRLLGYSASELVEKTWAEMTHPDDLKFNQVQYESVIKGQADAYTLEKRFIRRDGSILHAYIAACGIRKPDGTLDCFAVVIEDITDRVLADQARDQLVQTLQGFIDHLPGAVYVKDAESRTLFANKRFVNGLGLRAEDILGRSPEEIFPGEAGRTIVADDRRILATGTTETTELAFNGQYYESTKFIIPRDKESPWLGGITLDVTTRHLAELNLAQQVKRSAVLLELPKKAEEMAEQAFMQYALECAEALTQSSIAFMHFVNDDGESIELVAWSKSTLEKYCHATFDNHYPLSEAGLWADAVRRKAAVVINDYATAPNKHGLPAGHSVLKRFLSAPVMDGSVVRMVTGVGNKGCDYSEFDIETVQLIGNETWRIVRRQRSENALRLATQVVNASPVICFRWAASEGWPVVFVSDNVRRLGYTAEELKAGRPQFAEIVHPDDLARVVDEVTRNTAAGMPDYEQEYRLLTAENKVIWVVDRTIVQRDAAGQVEFYDGVLTDITERKIQQLMLAETLAQQKKLNKRLEDASQQLLQSEKMASIGQLAAGVAHELNNPIGFVHSNLGTLDGYLHDLMAIIAAYEKLADSAGVDAQQLAGVHRLMEERDYSFVKQDIFSLLTESKDGLGRVRKIVQDLKSFSRVGEQEWQEADLEQGIDSTLNIVWNELKYKCKVIKEYGEIPHVYCLISQLNQVFMNLLVNAGHAIEKEGSITIRTRRHGDDMVCIEFIDTGKGIAPEHLNRIFEPFFTTKPVGKGTGLGLSLSYSIVERHQGRIEVDSQPGAGSTFRLLLPLRPQPTPEKQDSEISS